MKTRQIISISLIAMLLTACTEMKQVDDMHSATLEMRDTTKSMNETTGEMKGQIDTQVEISKGLNGKIDDQLEVSEEMSSGLKEQLKVSNEMSDGLQEQLKVSNEMNKGLADQIKVSEEIKTNAKAMEKATDELYDALRQGNSLQLRREAWDRMIGTRELARKISEAAKYFMSFEFQLWTAQGIDAGDQTKAGMEKQRENLIHQAVQEFMMDLQEFYIAGEVKPFGGQIKILGYERLTRQQKHANFNAIAMTLDRLNRKQELVLKEKGLKPLSMYDLIKEALSLKNKNTSKAKFGGSSYIDEVLLHEDIARQLIQARHNSFSMVVLSKLTNIVKLKTEAMRNLRNPYTVDLSSFNKSQEILIVGYLRLMKESISFLQANNIVVLMNRDLVDFWKRMVLVDAKVKTKESALLEIEIKDYQNYLNKAF